MRVGKLTGKVRHVLHRPFFGRHLIVLQVEEVFDMPDPMGADDGYWLHWRDATAKDTALLSIRLAS